jgi:hypothetical protein
MVFADLARTELADGDPESVDPAIDAEEVLARLTPRS